jgi:hypothetical protein
MKRKDEFIITYLDIEIVNFSFFFLNENLKLSTETIIINKESIIAHGIYKK